MTGWVTSLPRERHHAFRHDVRELLKEDLDNHFGFWRTLAQMLTVTQVVWGRQVVATADHVVLHQRERSPFIPHAGSIIISAHLWDIIRLSCGKKIIEIIMLWFGSLPLDSFTSL